MKRIATACAALAMVSACGEPASEDAYEAIEEDVDTTQEPTQHFEPAEPSSDADMAPETDPE